MKDDDDDDSIFSRGDIINSLVLKGGLEIYGKTELRFIRTAQDRINDLLKDRITLNWIQRRKLWGVGE